MSDTVTGNVSKTLRPSHSPQKHTLLIVQYSKVAPKDVVHTHTHVEPTRLATGHSLKYNVYCPIQHRPTPLKLIT